MGNEHTCKALKNKFSALLFLLSFSFFCFTAAVANPFFAGAASLDQKQQSESYQGSFSESYRAKHPIFIPRCKSPRETIQSFFDLTRAISNVFNRGSIAGDIDWNQEKELIDLYAKTTYLIDSDVLPEKGRFARAHIVCSQLSEILDRIPVPDFEDIPDARELEGTDIACWRIPDTEIALSKIDKGPRKGDWIFSAHTVERANSFYERVKNIPFKENATVGSIQDKGGILNHYIDYTGPIIPSNFTTHLPDWMHVTFWGDPAWKFLGTFLTIVLILIIAFILRRLTRSRQDRHENINQIRLSLKRIILPAFLAILIPLAVEFITLDIRLRLLPLEITSTVLWVAFYIVAFWLTNCLGNLAAALIIHSPSITPFGVDASLVRLTSRLFSYSIGLWIVFEGLQNLGLSLAPLLAGVGIGGLAFAFAIKPTLGSLIGGVMIFADKPFAVGHRVKICGYEGYVEDIGIRSTRLRALNGHLITLPNDDVCNSHIENISYRPHIKRMFDLGITYDTPPEKIALALEITKQLLSLQEDAGKTDEELKHPGNRHINSEDYPPRVYFDTLNADSLNIKVIYWFSPPNPWKFLEHSTWVNTQLIERFNKAGIDFAFPTQTIELKAGECGHPPGK